MTAPDRTPDPTSDRSRHPLERALRAALRVVAAALLFAALALAPGTAHYVGTAADAAGTALWRSAALPLRLARLAAQPADEVLAMPVDGVRVRQIADTWGAPRSGGRRHQGQDIFAPRGTAVRSAAAGIVTRTTVEGDGGSRLGGTTVWLSVAGGRRLYHAHLETVADGVEPGVGVEAGTVLGTVGTSGNAAGTPPHLHFGVYGAGGAVDPLPLLTDR